MSPSRRWLPSAAVAPCCIRPSTLPTKRRCCRRSATSLDFLSPPGMADMPRIVREMRSPAPSSRPLNLRACRSLHAPRLSPVAIDHQIVGPTLNRSCGMWDQLTPADIQRARDRLAALRAVTLNRHAEETKRLDIEQDEIEAFERLAAAFAQRYSNSAAASQPTTEGQPAVAVVADKDAS